MVERMQSAEGEYGVVGRGETPPIVREHYWGRVKRALQQIFGADPTPADELRKRVEAAPRDTHTAFYHADLFEVAADLAGRRDHPLSESEKARYLELLDPRDRPAPPGG